MSLLPRILPTPAALDKFVPGYLRDMVVGTVTPGGAYMCGVHLIQLSRCLECAPIADARFKRNTERRRRDAVGRD